MASFNQSTLVGHLGRDPELRYTPSGKAVCNFSIAVNEGYTGRDGNKQDETLWMRVNCWEKTAENAAKYLKKGDPVLVSGKLKMNKFKDKDGNDRESVELTAFTVTFLAGARGENGQDGGRSGYQGRDDSRPTDNGRGGGAPRSNKNPHGSGRGSPEVVDDDIPY